jgi:cell division protein FtsZ
MNVHIHIMCAWMDVYLVAEGAIATTVRRISEMLEKPSLVDIDYADIRCILSKGGGATLLMGAGKLSDPPDTLVSSCLSHPVNDQDYSAAHGCLILLTGGDDLHLAHAEEIVQLVSSEIDSQADIIWGARIDPAYAGTIQVIVLLTGLPKPAC